MEESVQTALLLRSLLALEKRWTDSDRTIARDLATAVERNPPFWMPLSGPQTLAYLSEADELFYGGAAGGAKSWLLLGLAATAHRRSLVMRREATQLKELTDSLLSIAENAGRWRYSGYGGVMRGLPGDRQIELAGCDHEDDKQKWKGRRHDLKAYDEISDFTESQFEFINIWNGTPFQGQRCRRVGAGNPPSTAEGEWVIRRWAPWLDRQHPRPAVPGELRWFASVDGKIQEVEADTVIEWKGHQIRPYSRTFIPALLSDNPILEATGYGNTLANLPEPLRSMYLRGDFSAGREDHEWQVVPTEWVIAAQRRWKETTKFRRNEDGQEIPIPPCDLECMGVDVSRGGKDKTVLAKRHGAWFAPMIRFSKDETKDGPSVAGKVLQNLDTIAAAIHIDVIGIGSSPYDCLRNIKNVRLQVRAINFSETSEAKDRARILRMRNLRAEAYWRVREALDPKFGDNIALPPDPEILADLTAPRWSMTPGGVLIEPKEDIKERIGRSPDCFAAGTKVITENGNQPIENITIGTKVLTRKGWRSVVRSGITKLASKTISVRFSNGRILRGSANHPIFVIGRGWIPMGSLKRGDEVETCKSETLSYSTASLSFVSQWAKAFLAEGTITHSQMASELRVLERCIKKSGGHQRAKFLMDTRSTIATGIRSTTQSRILNVLRKPNTEGVTATRAPGKGRTLNEYEKWPRYGMEVQRGLPCIQKLELSLGLGDAPKKDIALSVIKSLFARDLGKLIDTVQALALRDLTTAQSAISSIKHVLYASGSSSARSIDEGDAAPVLVECVCRAPNAEVFNLSVEGVNEYYANGVVVHNCGDAIAMAMLPVRIIKNWKMETF